MPELQQLVDAFSGTGGVVASGRPGSFKRKRRANTGRQAMTLGSDH